MFSSCAWGFTRFFDTSWEEIMMCLFVFRRTNNLKNYSSNLIGTNFGCINKEIMSYSNSTIKYLLGEFCCSEKKKKKESLNEYFGMHKYKQYSCSPYYSAFTFFFFFLFLFLKCLEKKDAYLLLGIRKSEW